MTRYHGAWFSTKTIDEIDTKILKDLLKDGRKDFTEIAKEVGVSKNAIWKHYKEMERSGIIVGATAQVNYGQLGYYAIAEILVRVDIEEKERVKKIVQKIPTAIASPSDFDGKNVIVVGLIVKDLGELEEAKRIIGKDASCGKLRTYIWTGGIKTQHQGRLGVGSQHHPPIIRM